jgi:hypothetical protein
MTARSIIMAFHRDYDDPRHGTANGYNNLECRCDRCKVASKRDRDDRAARLAADPTLATHGTISAYANWGCRCDQCRATWRVRSRTRRGKRRATKEQP